MEKKNFFKVTYLLKVHNMYIIHSSRNSIREERGKGWAEGGKGGLKGAWVG